jgi:hypothetical protein
MAFWEISPDMLQRCEVHNNRSVFDKMNNIEVFYSAEFGAFLLDSTIIEAGKEKHLIHWVRNFSENLKQLPDRMNLGFAKVSERLLENIDCMASPQRVL